MSVVPVKFDLIERSAESYAQAFAAHLHSMPRPPDAALLITIDDTDSVRLRIEASSHFNQLEMLGLLERAKHMVLVNMSGEITVMDLPHER